MLPGCERKSYKEMDCSLQQRSQQSIGIISIILITQEQAKLPNSCTAIVFQILKKISLQKRKLSSFKKLH